MGSLAKLFAAGSPLIAAALAQIGLAISEEDISAWLNLAMWGIALLSLLAPSFRAWLNHKEQAE